MRWRVIAVGTRLGGWAEAAYNDYARRLRGAEALELCEVPPGRRSARGDVERAIAAVGQPISQGSAVLLRTGQERFTLSDAGFYAYPGMSREGTLYLASLGAKVLGTDAGGWDRPLGVMREAFQRTGDGSQLWDGHFAGREREVFIVQQLENLAFAMMSMTDNCFQSILMSSGN